MPDLNLTAIRTARARVADGQDRLREIGFGAADAQARREVALARGDDAAAAAAAAELARLTREQGKVIRAEQAARERLRVLSDRLVAQRTPEDAVATLAGNVPVLMLPTRLETRFSAGGQQLDVRIFPDQVHVTAHDPALTEDELAGLTWYWERRWPAPEDQVRADEAWAGLVARFRPGRAAFLVRAYPPTNLGSGASPRFDDPPMRASQWSAAARAALLPDRWCVLGFRRDGEGRHSEVFRVWGRAVPDTLAAGPGNALAAPAEAGGLPDDPSLRWLRDPAAAADVGMLVSVRQADCVAGFRLADGVDRLVALGVDWTLNPQQAADAVQAHLQAHADEGRLAFVPAGRADELDGRDAQRVLHRSRRGAQGPGPARHVRAGHGQRRVGDGRDPRAQPRRPRPRSRRAPARAALAGRAAPGTVAGDRWLLPDRDARPGRRRPGDQRSAAPPRGGAPARLGPRAHAARRRPAVRGAPGDPPHPLPALEAHPRRGRHPPRRRGAARAGRAARGRRASAGLGAPARRRRRRPARPAGPHPGALVADLPPARRPGAAARDERPLGRRRGVPA